jgi:hypothetical protein
LQRSVNAIPIDAALAGVNAVVAAGPKVFRISVFVVPPGIGDAIKLKRRKVAIVLH